MKCHKCLQYYCMFLILDLKYQSVLTGDCDLSQNALKGAGKLQKLLAQEKEHLESFIEAREKEKVFVNPDNEELDDIYSLLMKSDTGVCSYSFKDANAKYEDCKIYDKLEHSNSKTFIAAFTNGRLGNQMSAFATSYGLAKMFDLDVVMLKTQFDYLSPYFPNMLEDQVVIEKRFCDHCKLPWILRRPNWFRMVRNRKAGIKRGVAITLPAYSNEPEFYKDYLPELRKLFELDSRYKSMAKKRIDEALSRLKIENRDNLLLVGVHFRGTDYAAILKTKEKRADIGAKFYQKAFNFYRQKFSDQKPIFLVVTDDPKLAKFTLNATFSSDVIFVGSRNGDEPVTSLSKEEGLGLDLGILSSCDHSIITYSTFGLWTALMADGITVMSKGLEDHEVKFKEAGLDNWYFLEDN